MEKSVSGLPACMYCGAELNNPDSTGFVRCTACGRGMQITRFTQEDLQLSAAVEQARVAAERAAQAVCEAAAQEQEQADRRMRELREAYNEVYLRQERSLSRRLQRVFQMGEDAQRRGDFKEAIGNYYYVVRECNQPESEVYWRIALCSFGVEYVYDRSKKRWLPTITRMKMESFLEDDNYRRAIECARTPENAESYRIEAERIERIIATYRRVYSQEPRYDVFISVKQGDEEGDPTHDSFTALRLYNIIRGMGLKVFNSNESLGEHAGEEYEPYIMAALMSSKVMIVVGHSGEYISAPWVRNEWRRFCWLKKNDSRSRKLISYLVGMDSGDLPWELAEYQAISTVNDVNPLGSLRSAIRQAFPDRVSEPDETPGVSVDDLLEHAELLLEERSFDAAEELCGRALSVDFRCARAYLLKLCIERGVCRVNELIDQSAPLTGSINYKRALRYADDVLRNAIESCNRRIVDRNARIAEEARLEAERMRLLRINAAEGRRLYTEGRYKEALGMLRKATVDADAQCCLGWMYLNGLGVEKNARQALKWFRLSAEQRCAEAMFGLGQMYSDGVGVPQDDEEAARLYMQSANAGFDRAHCFVAWTYFYGRGVEQSDAEAAKWYLSAAGKGDADAQYSVGWMYMKGRGVEQNSAEAVKWLRLSAEQGYTAAQSWLGRLYLEGLGVPKDCAEAAKWLSPAAEQGNADAQFNLGSMYETGRGVAKNLSEAKRLYQLAAAQGCEEAAKRLTKLKFKRIP